MNGSKPFGDQNPYRAPRSQSDPGLPTTPVTYPTKPVRGISAAVVCTIGLIILIDLVLLSLSSSVYQGFVDVAAGRAVPPGYFFDWELGLGIYKIMWAIAMVPCSVLWWVWAVRAIGNVRSFGVPIEHSTASIVWCWFVPLLNFIRPYQVMIDVWQGSTAAALEKSKEWKMMAVPWVFPLWWVLTVVSMLLMPLTWWHRGRYFPDQVAIVNALVDCVACVVEMVAGLLLVLIVVKITRVQTTTLERSVL